MNLFISTSSMIPIYEQIVGEIKKQITAGTLREGEGLPSVRSLAKDLKISALTVKKSYDELERQGYIATIHGKGSYVKAPSPNMEKEEQRLEVEKQLEMAVNKAKQYRISKDELKEMFQIMMGE